MKRLARHIVTGVLLLGLLALAGTWPACGGGSGGDGGAVFRGNVSSVSGEAEARDVRSSTSFASLHWVLPADAQAQQTCPAERVLACVTGERGTRCVRVNATSCEFSFRFLVADQEEVDFFFIDDADDDGESDPDESRADLSNPIGPVCNRAVVTLEDLAIDFGAETAIAGSVDNDDSRCRATPTPTPPIPTATPDPDTTPVPTPTQSGDPTPTPTGGEEPTPTPTGGEEPTPTPTGGEEPTATPTPTGGEEPTPTPTSGVACKPAGVACTPPTQALCCSGSCSGTPPLCQ